MAEYIDKEVAFQICMGSWDASEAGHDIKYEPSADVVERAEYDKMVQSFRDRNENLKQNLINTRDSYFKLEKEIAELEVRIDKAIAEIDNQETWLLSAGYNAYNADIAFSAIRRSLKEPCEKSGNHAHWIDNHNGTVSCSYCGTWFYKDERYSYMHYCPCCNTKMTESEEGE
ncbi:hypothetical protein [Eubacterium oxidoreducens]|uniref:Coil containing protein n=1 Tax=Eubacterium oxidoreducens TaxID=1732 RepID=A0A1G6B1Y5_EUBOX|nr:hypothetical protein [Eubacterium oxidoreducens]SDB14668.1 hypothetical protein SAMN02910417_01066 [Eubacterium oxidoreducens]